MSNLCTECRQDHAVTTTGTGRPVCALCALLLRDGPASATPEADNPIAAMNPLVAEAAGWVRDVDVVTTPPIDEAAYISEVHRAVVRGMAAGTTRDLYSGRRLGILIGAVGVMVLLAVAPAFFAPGILKQQDQTPASSSATADLAQFSQYQRGQAADQGAVDRVSHQAVRTAVPGGTMYALRSGTQCIGVIVGGTVAGVPVPVTAPYCTARQPTTSVVPAATPPG